MKKWWIVVGVILVLVIAGIVFFLIFKEQDDCSKGLSGAGCTDQKIIEEVTKLYMEDNTIKMIIFPQSKLIKIKRGADKPDGFTIAIKNVNNSSKKFSYSVIMNNSTCSGYDLITDSWFVLGQSGTGIQIPVGEISVNKVLFEIPENTPSSCAVRFKIDVKVEGEDYATDFVDLYIID